MLLKNLTPPLFVALIIFSSCQREIESSFERTTNNNDSIYLKEFVELDTTLAPGSDTVARARFFYDTEKRVTMYTDEDYRWGPQFTEVTRYFYNGSDTLPYKAVVNYSDFVNDYSDTIFLFYNGVVVAKDSTITHDITNNVFWGTAVIVFTPNGNNTFIQSRAYNNPQPSSPDFQWSGMIMQTRVNGNITQQDDTTTASVVYTDRLHHQVSYDNKINPIYRTQIHYPIINGYKHQHKNNTIEARAWDIPGQFEDHDRYDYIYRSDGYPLSVTITNVLNPASKSKAVYIYTD